MKFVICHEIAGRMRFKTCMGGLSFQEADTLQYYIESLPYVEKVKIYERTGSVSVNFAASEGNRDELVDAIRRFSFEDARVPEDYLKYSGRATNSEYYEKIVMRAITWAGGKVILPYNIRTIITFFRSFRFVKDALKVIMSGETDACILHTAAIVVSILMGNYSSASDIMLLNDIGETLEEWTHKKSSENLARGLALKVDKVWQVVEDNEILVPAGNIHVGDRVRVTMGNVIPFDGEVTDGEAFVNQASMTGEAMPVRKAPGSSVFAGTILEEGEITLCVREAEGSGRFDRIIKMIEESEKKKALVESKASHLSDRLVGVTFLSTLAVYALTRDINKALSILMVDFSCAIKLCIPLAVLSAIRDAGEENITVKGGKFLEAVAEADTIVFDKTGTLTNANPRVADVICLNDRDDADGILRIAACLEEHFPHSMANAVVNAANEKNLNHDEYHTKVEYIVAHGISAEYPHGKAIIGSHHFVFDDEHCTIPEGKEELLKQIPEYYSLLYLAINGVLAGVICIEDPLREEATEVIRALKERGISNIVMMTGDNEQCARYIAEKVGVDRYFSQVLPEDKAAYIQQEREAGHRVIMIGDGINDTPALSSADVGIAIYEGADIAREIADITIGSDNLYGLLRLRELSENLMHRINVSYKKIMATNISLLAAGIMGVISPQVSAVAHNASTMLFSYEATQKLI